MTGLVEPGVALLRIGSIDGLVGRQCLADTEFAHNPQLLTDRFIHAAHLVPRLRDDQRRFLVRDGRKVFGREHFAALLRRQLANTAQPLKPVKRFGDSAGGSRLHC